MLNFPQMAPIVRTRFDPQPKWLEQWPNEPKIMNLLESGLDTKHSMILNIDYNRLISIRMNKTNSLKKKNTPWSSSKKVCSYIFLLGLYKNSSSWLHNDFSYGFSPPSLCKGVLPFYIPFPSFISALHVQIRLLIS